MKAEALEVEMEVELKAVVSTTVSAVLLLSLKSVYLTVISLVLDLF